MYEMLKSLVLLATVWNLHCLERFGVRTDYHGFRQETVKQKLKFLSASLGEIVTIIVYDFCDFLLEVRLAGREVSVLPLPVLHHLLLLFHFGQLNNCVWASVHVIPGIICRQDILVD